jgi:hypothetical protein
MARSNKAIRFLSSFESEKRSMVDWSRLFPMLFGEILASESIIASVKDGTRRTRRKTTWDEDEAVARAEWIGS